MSKMEVKEVKNEEMDVCRLCLGERPWVYIFDGDDGDLPLVRTLESLCRFKMDLDDGLPKFICSACGDFLESVLAFKERCEASDRMLRQRIEETKDEKPAAPDGPEGADYPNNADESVDPLSVLVLRYDSRGDVPGRTGPEPRLCPFCGESFARYDPWEEHVRGHRERPFECDCCGKTYVRKGYLATHMNDHTKSLQCHLCAYIGNTPKSLKQHIQSWHDRSKPLECEHCGKIFYRQTSFRMHRETHTLLPEFVCETCGRKFKTKIGKEGHMRTHTGERPFVCVHCGKGFGCRATMTSHVRLHTGETPHHCPVCDKGFVQLSNMKSHFRNNHKGVPFIYQNKRTTHPRWNKIKNHSANNDFNLI